MNCEDYLKEWIAVEVPFGLQFFQQFVERQVLMLIST